MNSAKNKTESKQVNEGVIEGHPDVILVYSNTYRFKGQDDSSFPFTMECNLSPPGLMEIAFIMMYGGSEECRFKGKSVDALVAVAEMNMLPTHPRLRWIKIFDPTMTIVKSISYRSGWVEGKAVASWLS